MAALVAKKPKNNGRKHKSKSLIVPTSSLVSDNGDDECDGRSSKSADCEPSGFDLRHRFSFRSFRRGRSLSKSRLGESTPPTNTTPPPLEDQFDEKFTCSPFNVFDFRSQSKNDTKHDTKVDRGNGSSKLANHL